MTRILPRLLNKIKETKNKTQNFTFPVKSSKKKIRSLFQPVQVEPSFHPADCSRSILLNPNNPIIHSDIYRPHKSLPPSIRRPNTKKEDAADTARQRTKQETEWWSNPYMRMLASPIRHCFVTERYMPTDFLVRLGPMRLPATDSKSPPQATLAPDGILHSKYTARKVGKGTYVFCWRKAIEQLPTTFYKRISQHLFLPDTLADHVAHMLRLRVLQELELLTEQVEFASKKRFKHTPVIRRLSDDEWGQLRSTNRLPCERALAVMILPPLGPSTQSGMTPVASMSPMPPQDQEYPQDPPPICEMLPFDQGLSSLPEILPQLRIPLYNAISAFPSQSQRAALQSLLLRLLAAERKLLSSSPDTLSNSLVGTPLEGSSHAFLLSSTLDRDQQGDPAALAVALWRLHMYERSAWSDTIV